MLWIKDVGLLDSVDDLMSSSSFRGIRMPNFDVFDARIASALNRIIHNSQFKIRIRLEEQKAQKENRFFNGRQVVYLIYEYFRVIGANDSVGSGDAEVFVDQVSDLSPAKETVLFFGPFVPPD